MHCWAVIAFLRRGEVRGSSTRAAGVRRSFGVGNAEVGAVISAFALMRLISSPLCGWLIKIFSERIIMATSIFIVAISSGLARVSGNSALPIGCSPFARLANPVRRCSRCLPSRLFSTSKVEAGVRGRAQSFFQASFHCSAE